jgi:hypothetical protein
MRRGESMRDMETAMKRLAADIDAQVGSLHQDDDLTVLSLRTAATGQSPAVDEAANAMMMTQ